MVKKIKFALVAGEDSGDILGADLIQHLKSYYPDAIFEGIGGHRMIAQGLNSFFPLERLSVMGLIEPLKRLPELLSIRNAIKTHFINQQPTVYIGIDAPDFNLSLERHFKEKGIKTVHYVSPTVWAWRKYRIKKIKKSVDLMLSLFPFETKIYEDNAIPIKFVGHPLADAIPLVSDKFQAREELKLPHDKKIVAILAGSREQELRYLANEYIEAAAWLKQHHQNIEFITACANEKREKQFREILRSYKDIQIHIFNQKSTTVMAAADVILLTSGTASLEAMLVKRPTVVAYKMSPWVFAIAKKIVKVPYIALPNLLANKLIMPEFIQENAKAENMGKAVLTFLNEPEKVNQVMDEFNQIHQSLKKNAGFVAASEIANLIGK